MCLQHSVQVKSLCHQVQTEKDPLQLFDECSGGHKWEQNKTSEPVTLTKGLLLQQK